MPEKCDLPAKNAFNASILFQESSECKKRFFKAGTIARCLAATRWRRMTMTKNFSHRALYYICSTMSNSYRRIYSDSKYVIQEDCRPQISLCWWRNQDCQYSRWETWWYDVVWYDMIWYDIIWYNMIYDQTYTTQYSMIVSRAFQTIWQIKGIDDEFELSAHWWTNILHFHLFHRGYWQSCLRNQHKVCWFEVYNLLGWHILNLNIFFYKNGSLFSKYSIVLGERNTKKMCSKDREKWEMPRRFRFFVVLVFFCRLQRVAP